jgi:L-amino acid N-acyltransferase YncA
MHRRSAAVLERGLPWLVAESAGAAIGYAYASPWRARPAYRFSVESTVYVAPEHMRRGVGSALYAELLDRLRVSGIHTVMGGIALPNDASVRLHEKLGMKRVAHFHDVGFKFGQWVDVGYWQLVFPLPVAGQQSGRGR